VEGVVEALRGSLGERSDGARLRALIGTRDRLDALICDELIAFERSGAYGADGARTAADWLRQHANRSRRDASLIVNRAARLRDLPEMRAAWIEGRLSSSQIDAVVATVNGRTAPLLAAHGADVVAALQMLSARDTVVAMRHWAAHAEALVDAPEPPQPERALYLSAGLDGDAELTGHLDAASFAIVDAALNAAATPDVDGEPSRTAAQRRADALVAMARFCLDHADVPATARRRSHLNVVVTLDELQGRAGRTLEGRRLDAATVAALACDASIHRVITDGASVTLDVGRATRTVGPSLFTALALRDQGCRFPGCDRPVGWCEAHHIVSWQRGGVTNQDNLVLLCWRHHHDVAHGAHWNVTLSPDGSLNVITPDGRVLTSRPPPAYGAELFSAA
jgi:hypothetical protein